MHQPHRIILLDDHPPGSSSICCLLDKQPGFHVVDQLNRGSELFLALAHQEPDLVIFNLDRPAGSVLELVRDLIVLHPGLKMLIITDQEPPPFENCRLAGAMSCLRRRGSNAALLSAIRQVLAGRTCFESEDTAHHPQTGDGHETPLARCNEREFEVFRLVGKGRTVREIAFHINLTPKGVTTCRHHLQSKLGYTSQLELQRAATRWVKAHS